MNAWEEIKKAVKYIIGIIISIILTYYVYMFWDEMKIFFGNHPIFIGVIISWFFAISSTGIILFFAKINSNKSDQYKKIFKKTERRLICISIAVLFYISINLASEALTKKGVPVLSTHNITNFVQISLQDAFLISFIFMTIILLFLVAPHYEIFINWINELIIPIVPLIIIFGILFLFLNYGSDPEPKYLFSWDEIPGNDSVRLIDFLKQNYNVDWVKKAKIEKINDGRTIIASDGKKFLSLNLNDEKSNVNLKIYDIKTDEFNARTEDGKLNIYNQNNNGNSPELNQTNEVTSAKELTEENLFLIATIIGGILTLWLWFKTPVEKKVRDLYDLSLYFSIIPAPIVASLVLIEHKLVTYPNIPGHIVVGFLFISGFASLVILTVASLKNMENSKYIWKFTAVLSFFCISLFSCLFLCLKPYYCEIDTFRNTLLFSIAIILLILQYGFSYEKLLKYKFTGWWRREWRPLAMVISILIILIIGALSPEGNIWFLPKLIWVFLGLILVVCLPWILALISFRKTFWEAIKKNNRKFRGFKQFKIPPLLPAYQVIALIETEPGPDKLKKIVEKMDSIKGVYQTFVVMGEYDVCCIVEGVNFDDIAEKILKIRETEGVASTTTLTDIRESFDRMVNYNDK